LVKLTKYLRKKDKIIIKTRDIDKVVNNRILLLSDPAHMTRPRTGAGAYSAMVDAIVLETAFKQGKNIQE
jgi:2-polyprenyl-6-methoxyphenol hydroxylase-like FAD-dependent oxidoreductase